MGESRRRVIVVATSLMAATGCSFLTSLDELTEGTPAAAGGGGDAAVSGDAGGGGDSSAAADGATSDSSTPSDGSVVPQYGCSAPQDPALVAYWPFDEGSGTAVKDCTKSAIDGVLVGGAKWTAAGKHGAAITFDGNTSCVDFGLTNATDLPIFTVALWAKVQSYAGSGGINGYLLGRSTDPNAIGWRLASDSPSILEFKIGDTPTPFTAATPSGQPTGTWLHVALVYDALKRADIYINGAPVKTSVPTTPIVTDTAAKFLVGCNNGAKDYFVGALDDVRIYSRTLTAAEIIALAK